MTAAIHQLAPDTTDNIEAALIAAFFAAKPAARTHTAAQIQPRHFEHGRHRTLWEHATRLHATGNNVDVISVIDSLDRAGHLTDVGGIPAVSAITTRVDIGAAHLPDYTAIVLDRARHRHATAAAVDLLATLRADNTDTDTAVHNGVREILHAGRSTAQTTIPADTITGDLDHLWTHGPDRGWTSGWQPLDRLYRPTHGQLTVITGVPNAGKTTWLNAYLTRLAHRRNHRYLLFSPEQSSIAKHARNLAVAHADPATRDEQHAAAAWVTNHFTWIDHTDTTSIEDLIAAAQLTHDRAPHHGLVIDPWNWLEATRPSWMSETEFVGHALNETVRAAQTMRVHVWIVAHPRKVEQSKTDGQYQIARPYDIAGSANWFNKPWFVLSLWRDHLADGTDPDRDPTVLQVHVQKVRDDDQGDIGRAELRMQKATRRYAPLATTGTPL